MSLERIETQVPCHELEIGMHVVRLDRPWEETDFLIQGFVIQTPEQLRELQACCDYVFIEGVVSNHYQPKQKTEPKPKEGFFGKLFKKKPSTKPVSFEKPTQVSPPKTNQTAPAPKPKAQYINKVSLSDEMRHAGNAFHNARQLAKDIMTGIRIGKMLDINRCKAVVDECVDSVLRNQSALAMLTQIKHVDEYTAEHSMNVCILSAAFARHLGLEEAEIRKVALGGLLHDVGKAKIPLEVLNKTGRLTDEEMTIMMQHPSFGRNMLLNLPAEDRGAVDVAFSHHERPNGTGYPRQLRAEQIPYFAKIVSLADTYDAITSNRCYDQGRSSQTALDIIYDHRGSQFDEELALEFIKCIGVFPPGAIVEMTNGEVAIVIEGNLRFKLRPKVLLVLDADKQSRREKVIDLMALTPDPSGQPYVIAHELPNGSHGVDLAEYLRKGLVLRSTSEQDHLEADELLQLQ